MALDRSAGAFAEPTGDAGNGARPAVGRKAGRTARPRGSSRSRASRLTTLLRRPIEIIGNRWRRTVVQPLEAIESSALANERAVVRLRTEVAYLESRLRHVETQLSEIRQSMDDRENTNQSERP